MMREKRPKGKVGRRLHKIGGEVDTLVERTDVALTDMERLKHHQQRSVTGWDNFVDRIQYARQSLDTLLVKQDAFSFGCDKRSMWGEAELDNFETVPEKWQQQREHEKEAQEQMRLIQEEVDRKRRQREAEDAWVTSDDVYRQSAERRATLVDEYEDEYEEEEEEEDYLEEEEDQEEEVVEEAPADEVADVASEEAVEEPNVEAETSETPAEPSAEAVAEAPVQETTEQPAEEAAPASVEKAEVPAEA